MRGSAPMPGAFLIVSAEWATLIDQASTFGVGERDEAGVTVVDVDEHPLGAPGLAVEVDLTNTAQPLPA